METNEAIHFSAENQSLIEDAARLTKHLKNAEAKGDWELAALMQRTLDELLAFPDTFQDIPL